MINNHIFAASILQNVELMLKNTIKKNPKPICIVQTTDSLYIKIKYNINKFHSEEENIYQMIHVSSSVSDEELIALLVELYEEQRNVIIISSFSNALKAVLQTIRYHNKPTIVHHVDESVNFLDHYYNTSSESNIALPDKTIQNILRVDCSSIQQHQFTDLFSQHVLNTTSRVYRLGQIKDNLYLCEPAMRSANAIVIDMKVLKYNEFPSVEGFSQSGLTSEEACMMSRHAGLSNDNKITLIHGIEEKMNTCDDQSANVLAQMIWYYYQGLVNQYREDLEDPKKRISYHVSVETITNDYEFIKSQLSGRWWYKSPIDLPEHLKHLQYYPCHYEDYLEAVEGYVPDEILLALDWFSQLEDDQSSSKIDSN